jgi:hypothetical protein
MAAGIAFPGDARLRGIRNQYRVALLSVEAEKTRPAASFAKNPLRVSRMRMFIFKFLFKKQLG